VYETEDYGIVLTRDDLSLEATSNGFPRSVSIGLFRRGSFLARGDARSNSVPVHAAF